jgi:hypothetical protein
MAFEKAAVTFGKVAVRKSKAHLVRQLWLSKINPLSLTSIPCSSASSLFFLPCVHRKVTPGLETRRSPRGRAGVRRDRAGARRGRRRLTLGLSSSSLMDPRGASRSWAELYRWDQGRGSHVHRLLREIPTHAVGDWGGASPELEEERAAAERGAGEVAERRGWEESRSSRGGDVTDWKEREKNEPISIITSGRWVNICPKNSLKQGSTLNFVLEQKATFGHK